MRPKLSDGVVERLKNYVESIQFDGVVPYEFRTKGRSGWGSMTIDDAVDYLLREVGF